jgi:hypothetical protein
MSEEEEIRTILVDRDVRAFVDRDWSITAPDFAPEIVAYSGASGELRLAYPSLEAYRDDWLRQAGEFVGMDAQVFGDQLRNAQQLTRIEIADGRALATKVFDGSIDGPVGPVRLEWTSHYFLRRDAGRWVITGFVGYLPTGGPR